VFLTPDPLFSFPVQWGPWEGQDISVDMAWLKQALTDQAGHVDWQEAAADVERFLKPQELHGLKLWCARFFQQKIEQL
jgi:hypothetical protein